MTRRILVGLVLAVGILFPAASTAAQTQTPAPSPGSIGIRLLEAPVSRENDPRAKIYIIDRMAQGTTISRKIGIVNLSSEPQTMNLYSGAATIAGGSFVTRDGRGGNEVAGWTTVAPEQVTVAPGQTAQAVATIHVPDNASDGERYGVVWAERVAAATGPGVTVINRVGIRVYLSVGVGTEPPSDFRIDTLQAKRLSTGEPAVSAMVTNTGGRALDMGGTLQLRNGPGGLTAGPFKAELGTTLGLGQTEPVLVKLDKRLPAGPWDAVMELQSGELQHSAHATITFPKTGSGRPVKASSLGKQLSILLPIAGIVAALFAAILLALWRRRRDKDDDDVKADLRRFDKLMKQQLDGTAAPDAEDPEIAIKAAIKQAGRAGDKDTERRLKEKLEEFRAKRDASKPAAPIVAEPKPVAESPVVVETPPVVEEPVAETPAAPSAPSMADILAGVDPEPQPEPTRWGNLIDDIKARKAGDDAQDAEDAPQESELARAVREAAEQARKAAEDASSRGQ